MHPQSASVTHKKRKPFHWGLIALGLILFVAYSRAQVSAPRIGWVRYGSGGVYPVLGVPGNYLTGPRAYDAVDALSFSKSGGILLRGGVLLLTDPNLQAVATYEAGANAAAVDIGEALNSAIAWIPAQSLLVHWDGSKFIPVPLVPGVAPTHVLGVQKSDDATAMLLARSSEGELEEYRISLRNGTLLSRAAVPGMQDAELAAAAVFPQGNFLLAVAKDQLFALTRDSGQRKALPIHAGDVEFERTSSTAVHVHLRTSGRDWLVQFTGDQPALFELPVEKVTQ